MKAPLSFYARNPIGRILNRLSQDINVLDELLPYYAYVTFNCFAPIVSTILLASITSPWLILAFLFSMPLFYVIGSIYMTSSADIKRLMLMAAGPVYSHFSNTMEGLKTIRIHSRQKEYTEQVFR
jgi:ATP-binding cassette subfamily C (CFTR/MRP) protein 4